MQLSRRYRLRYPNRRSGNEFELVIATVIKSFQGNLVYMERIGRFRITSFKYWLSGINITIYKYEY